MTKEFSNAPRNAMLCPDCGDDYHLAGQCDRCNCGESEIIMSKQYLALNWYLPENTAKHFTNNANG